MDVEKLKQFEELKEQERLIVNRLEDIKKQLKERVRVRVDIQHSAEAHDAVDAVTGRFGAEHYAGAYQATERDDNGYETIVFVGREESEEMAEALRREASVEEVRIYSVEDYEVDKSIDETVKDAYLLLAGYEQCRQESGQAEADLRVADAKELLEGLQR